MSNTLEPNFIKVGGRKIEVSAPVYAAHRRWIWRIRYHALKAGECACTKSNLPKCKGDCALCRFRTAGRMVSLESPIVDDDPSLTLIDTIPNDLPTPDEIAEKKDLYNKLHALLTKLDATDALICRRIMEGATEREIAAELGVAQSTLNYRKRKIFSRLAPELTDYL